MNYNQTLDYLYSSTPAFHLVGAKAYKPGLDNTIALMEHLGNPHLGFLSIHIAGTNGKGSTSHLIAAALQQAGLRVGLYTSPHLVDYRERIRINGEFIPEQQVIDFVERNHSLIEEIRPSFFEITMALAFTYFKEQKVDVAVIEVGLGGRLDSTNIITPLLSVITNIGMDHTEFLGHTLAQIASEKAGIIKPKVPVVVGESDEQTSPVFISKARETESEILFADQQPKVNLACQLVGDYQSNNIRTAYYALQVFNRTVAALGLPLGVGEEDIAYGFAHVVDLTHLRGRWEKLQDSPLTICDTGHNSHGIRYVARQLQQMMASGNYSRLRVVFGMVDDKDVDVVLTLLPTDAVYYLCRAATHRAIPDTELLRLAQKQGLSGRACGSVEDAIRAALADADLTDLIFIGGSNYVVAEALKMLG